MYVHNFVLFKIRINKSGRRELENKDISSKIIYRDLFTYLFKKFEFMEYYKIIGLMFELKREEGDVSIHRFEIIARGYLITI